MRVKVCVILFIIIDLLDGVFITDVLIIIQTINHHVEKWNEIVSSTGLPKFHLVDTREYDIALERVKYLILVYVVSFIILEIFGSETKVNKKNTWLLIPLIYHHIFRLEIIKGPFGAVHKFKYALQLVADLHDVLEFLYSF